MVLSSGSNMSQQLVRKLLKATSLPVQDASVVHPSVSTITRPQKKRKKPSVDDGIALKEEDIVAWNTKLLMATDRIMASSNSSKSGKSSSNAAAMGKLQRRREQKVQRVEASRAKRGPVGAARSAASRQTQLVKIPTYNKKRHEEERQEKQRMKLAKALEKLHSTDKSKTRKRKTIFG